jgi:Casein kinase substrate phosphoprotein PP28
MCASPLDSREIIEAARKKEEYQRRHMAGETEGAQREIAQLAIVKARREAAAK